MPRQVPHRTPDYLARTGLPNVPALEMDDGTTITESVAICRYLESVYPEPNLFGADPREVAVIEMWARRAEMLVATPLMLTGLACAVAFRARFYNIGAEGQLYLGALAAVAVGGLHGGTGFDLPVPVLFAGMMLAAALAGALLLLIPAVLKTRLGVDEVVTTLLGNFIVLLFVSMMLDGPMKDPMAMGWPQSVALNGDLELGKLIERTRAHTGLLWAAGLALGLWLLNRYTVFGFQMRAVGANAHASRFLGLPVNRVMLGTDYPFPLGEQEPGAGIEALGLSETERARLFHGTALEWLGVPISRFQPVAAVA